MKIKNTQYTRKKQMYCRSLNGWLVNTYGNMKTASKRREHALPSFTKQELCDWLLKNYPNEINELFSTWRDSGYISDCRPSVDRLNDTKGYTLRNIRLVTWKENFNKARRLESKPCAQLTLSGKLVRQYPSIHAAAKATGINRANIYGVINKTNKCRTAGGYVWH